MNDLLSAFDITGRVVLITGASSGFGRHFSDVLAPVSYTHLTLPTIYSV